MENIILFFLSIPKKLKITPKFLPAMKILIRIFNCLIPSPKGSTIKYIAINIDMKTVAEDLFLDKEVSEIALSDSKKCQCKIQIISPLGIETNASIFYVPGGAFMFELNAFYKRVASRFAKILASDIWLVQYPLLPEYPFPYALLACMQAYSKFIEGAASNRQLILMGDSAGGNLVISLLILLKENSLRLPNALITFSPWLDLSLGSPSIENNDGKDPIIPAEYLPKIANLYVNQNRDLLTNPLVSPVYFDSKNMPPFLMVVGEREILLDDTLRFVKQAKNLNIPVKQIIGKEMPHIYPILLPKNPESKAAIDEIKDFLKKINLNQR